MRSTMSARSGTTNDTSGPCCSTTIPFSRDRDHFMAGLLRLMIHDQRRRSGLGHPD
jgi:hypothetical protein